MDKGDKIFVVSLMISAFLVGNIATNIFFYFTDEPGISGDWEGEYVAYGFENNEIHITDIDFTKLRVFEIESNSMAPGITTNNLVIVYEYKIPEIGDIIVFEKWGNNICHRIYSINEDGYETKGDANQAVDDFVVPPENVIGVVIAVLY